MFPLPRVGPSLVTSTEKGGETGPRPLAIDRYALDQAARAVEWP